MVFCQKAGKTQWQGVAVGLLGAALLILPMNSILHGAFEIEGDLAYGLYGVLATMMYGTSVNTLKMQLPHLKALTVTTLSLASAAPFTIAYSLSSDFLMYSLQIPMLGRTSDTSAFLEFLEVHLP